MTEALLGFLAIFVLALMRMPLAFSMGLVGIVGIGLTRGWMPATRPVVVVVAGGGETREPSTPPPRTTRAVFPAR